MSRTDTHRPIWVQALDPRYRCWFLDQHDHSRGECDLSLFLSTRDWIRTSCYRTAWTQAPNLCGCNLCVGTHGRRLARRQERRAWRLYERQLLEVVRSDDDELEIVAESWPKCRYDSSY